MKLIFELGVVITEQTCQDRTVQHVTGCLSCIWGCGTLHFVMRFGHLVQDRDQWGAVVNTMINLWFI